MKKSQIASLILIATTSAIPATSFAFGGLTAGVNASSGSGASANTVNPDDFLKNAATAEALMKNSLSHLTQSLAAKEDIAKIEALQSQAANTTDAKEKESIEGEIIKSQAASLNSVNFDKVSKSQIASMDANQKKKLGAASFNFLLAIMKDKELVAQSSSLLSSMKTNPMMATKLPQVTSVAKSLGSQVEISANLVSKLPKILASVGIKEAPKSTSTAPMVIAD